MIAVTIMAPASWLACSPASQQIDDASASRDASADSPDQAELGQASDADAADLNAGDAGDGAETEMEGGVSSSPGTLTVDTTCGLEVTAACPRDHLVDGHCGLEEAVMALADQKSEYGCAWSGTIGVDDRIVIPTTGTVSVTTSLRISRAVTIMSAQPGTLATIQAPDGSDLFGLDPTDPVTITFRDLHMVGAGQTLPTLSTGISISGDTPIGVATINVTECWIERFSNGAIVASDVNLNVADTTLDGNDNDFGDGGGAIFYSTGGDAKSQTDFLTITNSSITHNHSTKGGALQIQSNSISRITNSTISDNLTEGGHGGGISFANNAGPLADGVLQVVESTIAYNGSTDFDGGGIAVAANQELFVDNIDNRLYLVGSIVANNCLARENPDQSFVCLSPNDIAGDIYQLQDSLLGTSALSTIVGSDRGGVGLGGGTLVDVDPGLDPELTDQGGVGEHHPRVHALTEGSIAVDATGAIGSLPGADAPPRFDQTHQARGFDYPPVSTKTYDLGAVEKRTPP